MPEESAAEDEIFEPGFARTRRVALECGDDIERQALQLETDIKRDEIVGRDHHQHAGGCEQHEHGKLEFHPSRPAPIIDRHEKGDGSACEREELKSSRKWIDDEAVVEQGGSPSPPATKIPASTRRMIASQSISSPRSRLVATPSISSTMEPPPRMSSGSTTSRLSERSIREAPYGMSASRA
jgi:hypothetical protein